MVGFLRLYPGVLWISRRVRLRKTGGDGFQFTLRQKQPLEYPSAGSTFKRPEGYFAAKLIEDAGLKGCARGGAQVSEKHAGFVVNKGDATAKDVCELTDYIKSEVMEKFGVGLELEVVKVGF